jgi:SOS-response transcriptional repressor LexA
VVAKIEDPATHKKLMDLSKTGIQVKAENTAMDTFKTPTKPGFFNAVSSSLSTAKLPKRT